MKIILQLLIASMVGGTRDQDFGTHMILSTMERLVDRTMERFEAIELLTILEGPEKSLLKQVGIVTSDIDPRKMRDMMKYVKIFFDQNHSALRGTDPKKHDEKLNFLLSVGDTNIAHITKLMVYFPESTETLQREYALLKNLLLDWKIWRLDYQQIAAAAYGSEFERISGWSVPETCMIYCMGLVQRDFTPVLDLSKTFASQSPAKEDLIRRKVKEVEDAFKTLNPVVCSPDSDPKSTAQGMIGVLDVVHRKVERLMEVLPKTEAEGTKSLVSTRRMIGYQQEALEFLLNKYKGELQRDTKH